MAAKFEVRQRQLQSARKIFGQAIGRCPKNKIFREYIQMEMLLGNFDRCRKIYTKWVEADPPNCQAWTKFAKFESELGEIERARALYELAIG